MNSLRRICAVIFLIVAVSTLKGQSVSGSTTVDIDPDTGMVTATCETDVDWASQGYYQPMVGCELQDGDGNRLQAGQEQDFNGSVTAIVVLQIQGAPGTTYVAIGNHMAMLTLPTDEPDGACGACQIDEYNFQEIYNEFFNGGIPYSYPVYFYGPGPEEETPAHVILIAKTTGGGKMLEKVAESCHLIANGSFFRLTGGWIADAGKPNQCIMNDFIDLPTTPGGSCDANCYNTAPDVNNKTSRTCVSGPRYADRDCLNFVDHGFPVTTVTLP